MDLEKYTRFEGEHEVEVKGIKIWYVNNDSRKNIKREIEIVKVNEPIIVRYFGNASCSESFEDVYLVYMDGDKTKMKMLEPQIEYQEIENEREITVYAIKYVIHNGEKVIVSQKKIETRRKPMISVKTENNMIYISGDTYNIRDKLKAMGFKWDPSTKTWYRESSETTIEQLRKIGVMV